MKRKWEKNSRDLCLRSYRSICLVRLKTSTKYLNESPPPRTDSNPIPPERFGTCFSTLKQPFTSFWNSLNRNYSTSGEQEAGVCIAETQDSKLRNAQPRKQLPSPFCAAKVAQPRPADSCHAWGPKGKSERADRLIDYLHNRKQRPDTERRESFFVHPSTHSTINSSTYTPTCTCVLLPSTL
jgi:hypothetical protein